MGRYEISVLPRSFRQRIWRWNSKEPWQVSGSAVINGSFHNQFEWAPCTNDVAAERGTSRPRHRWLRLDLPIFQKSDPVVMGHTPCLPISWYSKDISHQSGCQQPPCWHHCVTNMMMPNILMPNRHQAINNQHSDYTRILRLQMLSCEIRENFVSKCSKYKLFWWLSTAKFQENKGSNVPALRLIVICCDQVMNINPKSKQVLGLVCVGYMINLMVFLFFHSERHLCLVDIQNWPQGACHTHLTKILLNEVPKAFFEHYKMLFFIVGLW